MVAAQRAPQHSTERFGHAAKHGLPLTHVANFVVRYLEV